MKMPPYWLQWIDDKACKLALLTVSFMIGVQLWWLYGVFAFIAMLTATLVTNTILLKIVRAYIPYAISRWFWIFLTAWLFLLR